jgi:aminoglycoside phosphotransferase (APT) family kinase protein
MGGTTDLMIASLNPYLSAHAPEMGAISRLEKFGTGQSNPTYKMTTDTGCYVLRAKPSGVLLKSAHLVEREYEVMSGLFAAPVPVPKMLHLATDENSPLGRAFFIMEYLEGRIFWDPSLPELQQQ